MIRYLPVLIELALLIYCLIDIIQTPEGEVRNLPKIWWIILVVILPLIGGIAWLVAGRPARGPRRNVPWPSTATAGFPEYERPRAARGPDDDPDFLADMRKVNDEQEKTLSKWEEDLRRREEQLRRDSGAGGEPDADESKP